MQNTRKCSLDILFSANINADPYGVSDVPKESTDSVLDQDFFPESFLFKRNSSTGTLDQAVPVLMEHSFIENSLISILLREKRLKFPKILVLINQLIERLVAEKKLPKEEEIDFVTFFF